MIGKKVIVRADRAGVFFGELSEQNGTEVKLINARKLWYWEGSCACEELAVNGVVRPQNCKFTVWVDEMIILNVEQIIPCTDTAISSIEGVKIWKAQK